MSTGGSIYVLTGKYAATFLSRVRRTEGCWYWSGAHISQGYGETWDGTHPILAHRAAYELWVGPIPVGYTIDHLCHNADPSCVGLGADCPHRGCVNPAHLEAVPISTNQLRAYARLPERTHCKRGHSLEDAIITRHGYKNCRTCRKNANANARGHGLAGPASVNKHDSTENARLLNHDVLKRR